MFLVDNYKHPIPNVNYIKESILGPGGDRDAFYSWFEITCSCSEEADCMTQCDCIRRFGQSYYNGLLASDNLNNEKCVFECSAFCSCGDLCHNRIAQRGPNAYLEIRKAGEKGFGVFALKTFFAGTFIAEYAGEIISKQVAEGRYNIEGKNKYILALKEHYSENIVETYLDSYLYGNISRYINHSCSPNCIVIPLRTGCVIPKAAIFSNRLIEKNEEITYSYQDSLILSNSKCLCESPNCQGFLPANNV